MEGSGLGRSCLWPASDEEGVDVLRQILDQLDLCVGLLIRRQIFRYLQRQAYVLGEHQLLVILTHLQYGPVVEIEKHRSDELAQQAGNCRDISWFGASLVEEEQTNAD